LTRALAVYVLCCASVTVVSDAHAPLFPDPDLEAAVRAQVYGKRDNKEPLTVDDVESLSGISAKGKPLKDLSGLERCAVLPQLEISNAQVTDLSALRGLPNIQLLTLNTNRIKDVWLLADLKHP